MLIFFYFFYFLFLLFFPSAEHLKGIINISLYFVKILISSYVQLILFENIYTLSLFWGVHSTDVKLPNNDFFFSFFIKRVSKVKIGFSF